MPAFGLREASRGLRFEILFCNKTIEELQRAVLVLLQAIGNYNLHSVVSHQAFWGIMPKADRECRLAKNWGAELLTSVSTFWVLLKRVLSYI